MKKLRAIGSFLLTLLFAIAAISEIFGWLEIKPRELPLFLTALNLGRQVTLLAAFLFIAAALSVSGYSLYLSLRTTDKLQKEKAEADEELVRRRQEWLDNTNRLVTQIASKQLEIDEMASRYQQEMQKDNRAVTLVGVDIEVTDRDDISHKRKIRPIFRNDYRNSIGVQNALWDSGASGVPGRILSDTLQVKRGGQWLPSPHGTSEALVYAGDYFRTWIAVDGEFSETDLKHRRERHLLGTLKLLVDRKEITTTL